MEPKAWNRRIDHRDTSWEWRRYCKQWSEPWSESLECTLWIPEAPALPCSLFDLSKSHPVLAS